MQECYRREVTREKAKAHPNRGAAKNRQQPLAGGHTECPVVAANGPPQNMGVGASGCRPYNRQHDALPRASENDRLAQGARVAGAGFIHHGPTVHTKGIHDSGNSSFLTDESAIWET